MASIMYRERRDDEKMRSLFMGGKDSGYGSIKNLFSSSSKNRSWS